MHRIGRTARAGATGIALSLCDSGELGYLRKIEQAINKLIVMEENHIYHSKSIASKRGRSIGSKTKIPQRRRFFGSRSSASKNNRPTAKRGRKLYGKPQRGSSKRRRKN